MAITTRKNRETGTMISVGRAQADFGICTDVPPCWASICEDHGTILTHRTKRLAEWHAPTPKDWCSGCMALATKDIEAYVHAGE